MAGERTSMQLPDWPVPTIEDRTRWWHNGASTFAMLCGVSTLAMVWCVALGVISPCREISCSERNNRELPMRIALGVDRENVL